MNMNQFTQKSAEALRRAQQIAVEYGHQHVDQEHVMLALTEENGELIPQLLGRCGVNVQALQNGLKDSLGRMPRISGPGREADKVYISPELEKEHMAAALAKAEEAARSW